MGLKKIHNFRLNKTWTTHIALLIKTVQMTNGPVLELGAGVFSTPLLHWLCAESGRKLFTYEADKNCFQFARSFRSRNHSIRFVEDWDKVDFGTRHWSVALIDHETERRQIETLRLKNQVDYLVLHDTNHKDYSYDKVWPHFKYIHHWKFCRPWTSVVSNFKSLDSFATPTTVVKKTKGQDGQNVTKISQLLSNYGTDKNLDIKLGHCYGKAYDGLFRSFDREAELDIIEIGIEYGESLLAWREFFPNANISGVDIKDMVKEKRDDIEYIISDVKYLKPEKEYDIVIDDGSHSLGDILHTVRNFKLKEGGIMIIEDCHSSNYLFKEIRINTEYAIELINMRNVNNQHDDFIIVLRNYGYNK